MQGVLLGLIAHLGPYSRSRFKVRPGLNPTFKPGLGLNRIPEAGLS